MTYKAALGLAYMVYRSIMKQDTIQQEILLMLGTRFSSRECLNKDFCDKNHLTEKEKLEEACWNGMLHKMLPEIIELPEDDEKSFLWQIKTASNFIELQLGQHQKMIEAQFSLDPYCFLSIKCPN